MTWHEIRGHDDVVERFRSALRAGRLASTFLFLGPPGIGKRTFARGLAQALLCERRAEVALDPCGQCPACVQLLAGSHPDVQVVQKPADKSFLPLELLIGDKEHRMREGLCYDISLKPFSGRRKIAIIDDADYLNQEGANCLLKTLEEPPPKSLLILIGTSEQRQLPTIRSRCQIVRFQPLPIDVVCDLLLASFICSDVAVARRAAELSEGSLESASRWCDETYLEFRTTLLEGLSQREFEPLPLAKAITSFVEDAGKEAAQKRGRMRDVVNVAADFYRRLMVAASGGASPLLEGSRDEQLNEAIKTTLRWWPGNNEAASACLEICLDALAHIDANANLTGLVEWWLDELGQTARTGRAALV